MVVLSLLALLSFGCACVGAYLSADSSAWVNYTFYLLPFRFWQLASGALLHLQVKLWLQELERPDGASNKLAGLLDAWRIPLAWLSIVLVGLPFGLFRSGSPALEDPVGSGDPRLP